MKEEPMIGEKPIPLTPEILKKNGFVFDGTQRWTFEQKGQNGFTIIVVPVQPDNEWWNDSSTGFEIWDDKSDIIREGIENVYINDLQIALSLCKIRKEIIL